MRALLLHAHDGLDGLSLDGVADPTPGPSEVLVHVRAVCVNRLDLAVMHGRAPGHQRLPHVMGSDPAGEVAAVGPAVEELDPGDRVVVKPNVACWQCRYCLTGFEDSCERQTIIGVDRPGGIAELVAVPQANVFALPPSVGFEEASAVSHSFPIAMQMLRERGRLSAADTVVVTGAAGGVGSAAVQLARRAGAHVVAVVSSTRKAEVATAAGAHDVVVLGPDIDLMTELEKRTNGHGVTLAIDTAGNADAVSGILRVLARRGRFVMCGGHAGDHLGVDPMWLYRTRAELIGSSSPSYAAFEEVVQMAGDGTIHAVIHDVLPWQQFEDAYRLLIERRNRGKVVLRVA